MKSENLVNEKYMKAGKILLSPGEEVGWHVTEKREEIIFVLEGTATIIENDRTAEKKSGEIHHIKQGVRHNVVNKTTKGVEYIYVVALSG